jgi:hypothetical protein
MTRYVTDTFPAATDRALLLDTEAELTRHFLTDLNRHAAQRRIILFFDSYEKTAAHLDGWFLDMLAGKFGQFSSRVFFIIAGEHALEGSWDRFRKATRQIKLREFSETEAREYLDHAGLTDQAEIDDLLELSENIPVQLAFLTSAPGGIPTDRSGSPLERFLAGASQEQREAALTAAVPQSFNLENLTELLGAEAATEALEWLSQARFVQTTATGHTYHQVIRIATLRHFKAIAPKQYNDTHRKLAESTASLAAALPLSAEQRPLNDTWLAYEQQRLYHRLSQNPPDQLTEVFGALLTNLWTDISMAQDERKRAALRHTYAILRQVAAETNEATVTHWADRLEQVLAVERQGRALEIQTFGQFFA